MAIVKLKRPLKLGTGDNVYPMTSADQIVKANGEKLEIDGKVNADALGGQNPSYYAKASENTIKTYNGLKSLGLNSDITISGLYTAIPEKSIFIEQTGGLTNPEWNFPTVYGFLIIEKFSHHRSSITLRDKSEANEWHMMSNSDGVPNGTWHRVGYAPFNFGVDANGNYGYIKRGADTVTPFKMLSNLKSIYSYTQPTAQNGTNTISIGNLGVDQALIVSWFKYTGTGTEGSGRNVYNWIASVNGATFTRLLGATDENSGMVFDIGLLTNIKNSVSVTITHNQSNVHANIHCDIFAL